MLLGFKNRSNLYKNKMFCMLVVLCFFFVCVVISVKLVVVVEI